MRPGALDHERLDVYRCAIAFLVVAVRIGARLGRGQAELRDQLQRASTSIPLNIAEASGKSSAADRARDRARLGARVRSHRRRARRPRRSESRRHRGAKTLLTRAFAMLRKMCR